MVSIKNKNLPIPTDEDIAAAERHVEEMKAARESAKQSILANIKSADDILSFLSGEESLKLMKALQNKLKAGHRKVRGSPVPAELKKNLESALKQGEFSLAQLEKIFNLSISYISRVKKDLGLTRHKGHIHTHNHRMQEHLVG